MSKKKSKGSKKTPEVFDGEVPPGVKVISPDEITPSELVPMETEKERKSREFLEGYVNLERVGGERPEYRNKLEVRRKAMEAVNLLRELVLGQGELPEQVKDEINSILNDHSNRSKAFIVGILHRRIDAAVSLMADLDRIEDELSTRNLETMNTETLMRLHSTILKREEGVVKFISDVASLTLPDRIEDKFGTVKAVEQLEDKVKGAADSSAASRRKVMSILDKLNNDRGRTES